ncbi:MULTISPECIES: hypothetical protein [Mesorhizobium]|uniref:hypothetical protein n=1 Tax=Mesorhizobium TaxID=68287 RepID=UPI0010A979A3|nr:MULTISPECIES: hypothetical protein [Mesorhizobium]
MTIRRQTVEHPSGTLKAWMGSTYFLVRALEKVKTEMSWFCCIGRKITQTNTLPRCKNLMRADSLKTGELAAINRRPLWSIWIVTLNGRNWARSRRSRRGQRTSASGQTFRSPPNLCSTEIGPSRPTP